MFAERVQHFLHDMGAVTTLSPDVVQRCQEELAWLYTTYADSTVHTKLTVYRNALRKMTPDHILLTILKESDEKLAERNVRQYTAVNERRSEQVILQDTQAIIQKAEQLLTSSSYTAVGVGLGVLTGRRPYEIFVTGFCRAIAGQAHQVSFSGLCKTDETRQLTFFPLYVLTDPFTIVQAFQKLRHLRNFTAYLPPSMEYGPYFQMQKCQRGDTQPVGKKSPYDRFHDSVEKTIGEVCKTHFKGLIPGVTLYKLRAAYVTIAQHTLGLKPKGMSDSMFMTKLLLHDERRLHSDHYYERYALDEEE